MAIPKFALGVLVGATLAAAAPNLVASALAQSRPPAYAAPAGPEWTPSVRYQYHVMNMGWGNQGAAEATFNSFGQDGWRVAAMSGSWVTFERSYPTR
jgi:hypothetical protein